MSDEILVIIPCLNEEHTIEALVQQLVQASASCPMRIVIVDGGSADKTAEIAKRLAAAHSNVTYLYNPKRIQSVAMNLAVAEYGKDNEFLVRLDAHAHYPDDYCAQLLAEAKATGAASIVVTMDTQGKTPFQRVVAATTNSKLGNGGSAHRLVVAEGKWVDHGHHALMRIDAYNKVGGYDETFTHNEDAELDTRLAKAGYKIWLTAKTNLVYFPRSSALGLSKQYFRYGRGRVRNIVKHRTTPKLRQLAPAAIAPAVLLALATPWCWVLGIPFFLWAALCIGYGIKLGLKANDNVIMLSGPAAMLMHFSWSLGFWSGVEHVIRGND